MAVRLYGFYCLTRSAMKESKLNQIDRNPATSYSSSESVYRCLGLALQAIECEVNEWKVCVVSHETCQVVAREEFGLDGESKGRGREEKGDIFWTVSWCMGWV